MKYGLSKKQLNELLSIFADYSEVEEIILFGSRALSTYKEASDIDLAVKGKNVTDRTISHLKDALEESDLPFFADIVNYQTIDKPKFKQNIDEYGVVLFFGGEGEWRETTIGGVCKTILTGGTPLTKIKEYYENASIPWMKTKEVNFSTITKTENHISKSGFENSSVKLIPKNSVIVTMYGQGDTAGRVAINKIPLTTNQACCNLIIDTKKSTYLFIYYFLNNSYEELVQRKTGSAQPNLNTKLIKSFEIKLPPLPEQKAIAEVLSSLDDKIDLLHRQNKTLEQIAETLFRQWFVEEAGEDWEEVLITDLFEIRDGTHDSPKQKTFGKSLITSKHMKGHYLDFENAYFISEEDFIKVNQRSIVNQFDILFSMIGTIGLIYIEQSNNINYAIKNVGLLKTSQNKKWLYFTYLWLSSSLGRKFVFENKSGSTQQYISLGSLRNIAFFIPKNIDIDSFNGEVESLFNKIYNNQIKIKTLENMRDILLPKLMNGEVRILSNG